MTQRQINWCVGGVLVVGLIGVLPLVLGLFGGGQSPFQGQVNATMQYYGKVVDQDGKPLANVSIDYVVEAYPKDWSLEAKGGNSFEVSTVSCVSGEDGTFRFVVSGCKLTGRPRSLLGYRELLEAESGDDAAPRRTAGYRLVAWGALHYKTAPEHPAIIVFVQDGVTEVSALPCAGGYSSMDGIKWSLNEPGWPKEPSLKDVVYRPIGGIAATSPASLPATAPATAPKPNVTDRR
jgi:hypothetical protein